MRKESLSSLQALAYTSSSHGAVLAPGFIITDFEAVAICALRSLFPNSVRDGYFFLYLEMFTDAYKSLAYRHFMQATPTFWPLSDNPALRPSCHPTEFYGCVN